MRRLLAAQMFAMTILTASAARPAAADPYREVEACFVLDTTGSMGGLIDAAKAKIWFIANEIANAPSKPQVRLCLMGFRDRGDAYVTKLTPLTSDVDAIYRELMAFTADGGGDTPEAVNQALLETVDMKAWSTRADVLRVVFLVGDAPPQAYPDEPGYEEIAARALAKGIVINPVLCGGDTAAGDAFAKIARGARGEASQIADMGAVERIATPVDQDLAALNRRLGRLIVPYGAQAARDAVVDKQRASEGMDDIALSDRLAYNLATGRVVQGGGDLIEALDAGDADLATLDTTLLPEAMRSMTRDELVAELGRIRSERAALSQLIRSLVEERRTQIEARRAKQPKGFDGVVSDLIARQLAGGS